MSIIAEGKTVDLLYFIFATITTAYFLYGSSVLGKKYPLRIIPGVKAISEGIDKAVEEGKPVYCTLGAYGLLSGLFAPMTIAGVNIHRYALREAVMKGAEVYIPVPMKAEIQPLIDGVYREVCVAVGKPEAYIREHVFYSGNMENNYNAGLSGMLSRTGCSCYVAAGALTGTGDTNPTAIANYFGALVIGGTGRFALQGTYAVLIQYPFFMDDIFCAGAYCSGDDVVMSTLWADDVSKILIIFLVIVTLILSAAGVNMVGEGGLLFY